MSRILALLAPFCFRAVAAGGAVAATAAYPASSADSGRNAYFGDLHLHTSYSFDAYFMGTTSVDPETAYRFARGELVAYRGAPARRREPLDFIAITDHGENLGVFNELENPDSELSRSPLGREVRAVLDRIARADGSRDYLSNMEIPVDLARRLSELERDYNMGRTNRLPASLAHVSALAWERVIALANRFNQPGRFTSFIAYEWTATPHAANLHRNVVFRADRAPPPFTSFDSRHPEDLWDWLDRIRELGFDAISIPHNSNASNGLMYDWLDSSSTPIDRTYAGQRQRNEPISEISQHKGSSETHPQLSPDDEFADFEIFDFMAAGRRYAGRVPGSYVRDALGRGLVIEREIGVNPYKFGFAGASDLHSGLSVGSQDAYAGIRNLTNLGGGKVGRETAKIILGVGVAPRVRLLQTTSGNLTGVWAESNTRDAIFAAFRRRETFATSGSRLKMRLFGGWTVPPRLFRDEAWATKACLHAAPMGSDLAPKPQGAASPTFVVWAVKDAKGANLERAQIVKVWEEHGVQRERTFDVAWSGGRQPDPTSGKIAAFSATLTPDVGSAELKALWADPQFDDRQPAAYYLRVLEVPTPRWSTLLAREFGLPLAHGVPENEQQRGWTSPIWYTPPGAARRAISTADDAHE